jgi:hypothetical protein
MAQRRVDFIHRVDDLRCATMGALGFATDFIVRLTGMSPSQVTYRLGKAHIRRPDYGNGRGPEAKHILNGVYCGV